MDNERVNYPFNGERWTFAQIERLKQEALSRCCLDPLWKVAADALASLQFDLIDARKGNG